MGFEVQLAYPTPEREHQLLLDSVDQAVFAEEMGFDRIWAPEHHSLKWYAHMSASEIFLTWVAARTSRIRIGHGVVPMPFNYKHPVQVAERAAMLDALSGGRVDLGAGRGATCRRCPCSESIPSRPTRGGGGAADGQPHVAGGGVRLGRRARHRALARYCPGPCSTRTRRCSWPAASTTPCAPPPTTASEHWCSDSPASRTSARCQDST